jgi:serine/threonine-protein kinase
MPGDALGHNAEATLPTLDVRAGLVCPRCHRSPEQNLVTPDGTLPRCPHHGHAYVDAHEILDSGHDPLLGTTVAGRFTVISRLGQGSMGAVYRARQEAVQRDVALKIVRGERAFDPETRTRFEREARATSSLQSPNTVTVFDFGSAEDGSWFLAMELLKGETLGDRLRRVGRLSVQDTVRIAKEALRSLAEAHHKGIIHRDLKPDNLFLASLPAERGGTIEVCKVLDFGIAKLVRGDDRRVDQLETQAGTVFGTPRYMSPEQAQGNKLDPRTDVYSLGVIIYQMLVGRPPFVDDDAVVVMARHIKDEPPRFVEIAPDAQIPPALEGVVRGALSKHPSQRQQSAEQLMSELEVALEYSSALATGLHSSWVSGPAQAPSRSRQLALMAVVLGVLLLSAIGFLLIRGIAKKPAEAEALPPPPIVAPAAQPVVLPSATSASTEPEAPLIDVDSLPAVDAGSRPKKRRVSAPATKKPDPGYGRFE